LNRGRQDARRIETAGCVIRAENNRGAIFASDEKRLQRKIRKVAGLSNGIGDFPLDSG
jgi:hypothetical protein